MENILIRKYSKEDRQSVRDIAWETAFMGEPASVFFSDKEIFSDFLTLHFTDYEPESCFIAEYKGNVVGYLIGARDENILKTVSMFKIMPVLFFKALVKGILLKKKDASLPISPSLPTPQHRVPTPICLNPFGISAS